MRFRFFGRPGSVADVDQCPALYPGQGDGGSTGIGEGMKRVREEGILLLSVYNQSAGGGVLDISCDYGKLRVRGHKLRVGYGKRIPYSSATNGKPSSFATASW